MGPKNVGGYLRRDGPDEGVTGPPASGDAAGRLNAALRMWSAECEPAVPPAARDTAAFVSPDETPVIRTSTATEGVSQSVIAAPPATIEQDPETQVEEVVDEVESLDATQEAGGEMSTLPDYYEILQISRKAEVDTVHRVFRIMAQRFHPDNPKTGNLERFLLLKRAYEVLSDPDRRAEYDLNHCAADPQPLPVFESEAFLYGIEGEMNRRLGVLSLLYQRRRLSEGRAGVSVLELEKQMAFPREYLNFTLWYLRAKKYVTHEENSDFSLTFEGVDYVEAHSTNNRMIRQLLAAGTGDENTVSAERSAHGAAPRVGTEVAKLHKGQVAKMATHHRALRRTGRKQRKCCGA
jgi:hypothetical protein